MALTADIITTKYGPGGPPNNQPLKANSTVYRGSVAATRSGYLVAMSTPQSTDVVWGIIDEAVGVANTGPGITGASTDGGVTVNIDTGSFFLASGTSGDAITQANVGQTCWLIDEKTVGATNPGGNTRPIAGVVEFIDPTYGVAVKLGSSQSSGAP